MIKSREIMCRKCSSNNVNMRYDAAKDILHCVCRKCEFRWEETPSDKLGQEG